MQGIWVCSLHWEELLEKEMATHSSIVAWGILCLGDLPNARVEPVSLALAGGFFTIVPPENLPGEG